MNSQCLIRSFLFGIWWQTFASECSGGTRQNSHSHSQPYRCDRGALSYRLPVIHCRRGYRRPDIGFWDSGRVPTIVTNYISVGRSFLLTARSFLLTARSLLLTLKFGLVFFTYGWNSVWSFLLTVENRFGLFYLRFPPSGNYFWSFLLTVPPVRKLVLVFFTYGSPTVSKKDEP